MSAELATIAPAPLALGMSEQEIAEFQEAFAENVSGGQVSVFHLDRIKMTTGGAPMWLVGEQPVGRIEGVILGSQDLRAYWKSKEAGNVPPDCSSWDCITGHGTPGGECANCALAEWDSAEGESAAQACKKNRWLFLLHGDSMIPAIVSLPPTSVDASIKYILKLAGQRIPKYAAITAIELEKAQSKAGKAYGKAKFTFVRRLSADEQARSAQIAAMCKNMVQTQEK